MKKLIYIPCALFLTLCVLPLSCATNDAAEKKQEAPVRHEQEAAAAPDAVSGATVDTVSGATVSRAPAVQEPPEEIDAAVLIPTVRRPEAAPVSQPDKDEAAGSVATMEAPADGNAPAQPLPQKPEALPPVPQHAAAAGSTDSVSPAAAAETEALVLVPAIRRDTPSKPQSDMPAVANAVQNAAQEGLSDIPESAASMSASAPSDESDPVVTELVADVDVQAASDMSGTVDAEPDTGLNAPSYEQTLADIISEFEAQGGDRSYEPPRSFHEQMHDLFSPQIFSVALSKEPETEQKVKVSRMVAVEEKQRLELTYPGHGWVYVGEQTSQQGLKYEQRKLQDNNSIFMFTAEKKGDYVLHFSYFDVFTNDFITDAVAVSVSTARSSAAKSMVRAPEYKNEAEAAEETAQSQPGTSGQTAAQQSDRTTGNAGSESAAQTAQTGTAGSDRADPKGVSTSAGVSTDAAGSAAAMENTAEQEASLTPEQLLESARTAIAAADANAALQYLDRFFAVSTEKLDEGWFLKGRAYELNGSVRNIRLALGAYRMLTGSFPQSKYWAEADLRIRYITNFYVNIQ
nr:hypothetical protein [uncultured Treponema sp.]